MWENMLPENIVHFIQYLLPQRSALFKEIEKECEKNHIPLVEPEVGQFLQVLLQIKQAKRILELGTGIGYSTLWLALAPGREDRQITTIELDQERYKRACYYFIKAGVDAFIKPLRGDANEVIPHLTEGFDFIFVDAAKGQYPEFFNKVWPLLEPGGVLVLDNILLNGWVIDMYWPERRKKTMVCRLRDLLEMLKKHPGLSTTVLPLGDGVSVSVKKIGI